jgi:hypothetical protein
MGQRIQAIVKELSDERIDVIEWSEDPKVLIANSLKPAKISQVKVNEAEHTATVAVAEDQLALAIGKGGQNIRLASRLTGWRIDVVNEKDFAARTVGIAKPLSLKEKIALAKARKVAEDQAEAEQAGSAETVAEEKKDGAQKVSKIAKELGLTSKLLLAKLPALEISAKSASSNLTEEEVAKIKASMTKPDVAQKE